MPHYRFPVFRPSGELVAYEDGVHLPDDDAARKYGEDVISELVRHDADGYVGWMMQIRSSDRLLASIPFAKPN
jgi:hypothetical protein